MTRYTGNHCPVCEQAFTDEDDIVVCPDCGTPYHRACWQKVGACMHKSEHAAGFEWQPEFGPEAEKAAHEATCPNCGTALEITDTRKRVFVDNEYFSIITTCKGYQVIRFFFVRSRQKVGQKAEYSIFEVAQRWIAPDGKSETVARLRGFSLLYYDLWNEDSPMEIRRNNQHKVYDIDPICTYPRRRIIPEIKRNGFDGNLHGILPYDFFKAILSDSRAETLLKSGNIEHLRYFLSRPQVLDRCWNSYKIAMRKQKRN